MKKIIYLSNSSGYGGAPRSVEMIVAELSTKYEVHVFAENDIHYCNLEKLSKTNENLFAYQFIKGKRLVDLIRNLFKLRFLIFRLKPICLITNTNKAALFAGLLNFLGLKKMPKLIFVRDYQWVNRERIWKLLKEAHICVPSMAVDDRKNYLPNGWAITEVPNFTSMPKEEVQYNPDSKVILCLAMVSKWKGIIYLVKGFKEAYLKDRNLKLVIVGKIIDEEYYSKINDFIKKNGLEKAIEFKTYTNDVASLYKQAQMVVNTSISEFGGPETFGRTIIEAWSYKVPVISFDCGGPKYIIEDGKNGLLVEEKNTENLGQKIFELNNNKDLKIKLGQQGFQDLMKKYNAENSVNILHDLIKKRTSGG